MDYIVDQLKKTTKFQEFIPSCYKNPFVCKKVKMEKPLYVRQVIVFFNVLIKPLTINTFCNKIATQTHLEFL